MYSVPATFTDEMALNQLSSSALKVMANPLLMPACSHRAMLDGGDFSSAHADVVPTALPVISSSADNKNAVN